MHKTLAVFFSFFSVFSTSLADDATGQSMHQAQCTECHSRMTGGDGSVIYTRKNSLIDTHDQLEARVNYCAQGANTNWSQAEIRLVSDYLNNQHYHY